jgi:hypothetical protein
MKSMLGSQNRNQNIPEADAKGYMGEWVELVELVQSRA